MTKDLDEKIKAALLEKSSLGPMKNLRERFNEILCLAESAILASANEPDGDEQNAKNLFDLFGARRLAGANKLSRLVSTHLGSAWEAMAAESHLAISPELKFGERIEGIDIVLLEGQVLRHTQIKTQKNTLTGSQKPRTLVELRRHSHPLFAAAFDVARWNFPSLKSCGVERIAGKAFWVKLGIDYDVVYSEAKACFDRLDHQLFD